MWFVKDYRGLIDGKMVLDWSSFDLLFSLSLPAISASTWPSRLSCRYRGLAFFTALSGDLLPSIRASLLNRDRLPEFLIFTLW